MAHALITARLCLEESRRKHSIGINLFLSGKGAGPDFSQALYLQKSRQGLSHSLSRKGAGTDISHVLSG